MQPFIKRSFASGTKNAIHIIPPLNLHQKNIPCKQILNLKLPLWEKIEKKHKEKVAPSISIFNDANPENYLNLNLISGSKSIQEEMFDDYNKNDRNTPLIIEPKIKKSYRNHVFTTQILQTSAKKAKYVFKIMIGKYYYDAVLAGMSIEKKVGTFIGKKLNEYCTKQLYENGFDPKFMFLTSIVSNRTKRSRKLRYHARGKGYLMKRDFNIFKITLTEKPIKEFYRQLIEGKTPGYIAYMIKEYLEKTDADYEEVRELQLFLTAKGRQQQRLMFSRKVFTRWLDYKKAGTFIRMKVLWEIMLEEEIESFDLKFHKFFKLPEEQKEERLKERKRQIEQLEV